MVLGAVFEAMSIGLVLTDVLAYPNSSNGPLNLSHFGWAHRALPLKSQLSAEHAQAVESAFAARLAKLNDAPPASKQQPGWRSTRPPA